MSDAWKKVERLVAAVLGGIRSWDTDHDVLVVTATDVPGLQLRGDETGQMLLSWARLGAVELGSVEVKNLTTISIPMVERFLQKNRDKADRDGVRYSALVVKRKAGNGRKTPALLIVDLDLFDGR